MCSAVKDWLYTHETVTIDNACGRILAQDVFARCDVPSFRRSTVDGYAVNYKNLSGAGENSPAFLRLAGAVKIGESTSLHITDGECVEVPTGGMIPCGANAVVMVEYTEDFGKMGIAISKPVSIGENIVEVGDDIKNSSCVLKAGTKMAPKDIGALAAVGAFYVTVYNKPTVAIISTGDELVSCSASCIAEIPDGKVRDISSVTLRAMAAQYGLCVTQVCAVPDDISLLEATLKAASQQNDIVVISGGSSYGKYDNTAKVIDAVSSPGIFTHGLALKPGKPTILAVDDACKTLFLGLPGHPVSAMIVFELLLEKLQCGLILDSAVNVHNSQSHPNVTASLYGGLMHRHKLPIPARLVTNVPGEGGKLTVYPCAISYGDGEYRATPVFGKSAMITTLVQADGYFVVDANTEGLYEGMFVDVFMFG